MSDDQDQFRALVNQHIQVMHQFMGETNVRIEYLKAWRENIDKLLIHGNGQPSMKDMLRVLQSENEQLKASLDKLAAGIQPSKTEKEEIQPSKTEAAWWQSQTLQIAAAIVFGAVLVLVLARVIDPADFG